LLREILEPMLRNPHAANSAVSPVNHEKTVLQSPLFAIENEKSSGRLDTTGWAHRSELGDAEGGVR